MAVNCIETGFKMLNGEPLSGWIKTPVKLVTVAELGGEMAAVPAPATESGESPVVGLVMKSLANEFFKTMEEGAVKYATERGDFELIPVGMNSETDIDTQISAVENFITQGVDLICLAPADSVGLVAPAKKALDAGITVVNFDVKLDDTALKEAGLEGLVFVGPDNEEGAYLAGAELGKKLGEGGKVIIIEGNPGADNARARKAGFERSVEEYKLELLDSVTAHWETEEANTVMTNLLTLYPDVQGVMAANDSMALGVVKAIEAAGMTGKIDVVGFDNIEAAQQLVKEGKMLATIDQFGPDMAVNCIETGFKMLNGEPLSGWIKTPVKLVTVTDLQ
jgi:ribose transport system substrate-binding protein